MRITFRRFPGHTTAYSIIERDDGVVYRLPGSAPGAKLPHDLRHLVVERELRIADGLWGAIAAGVVYPSMEHVRGRRPPPAAERSAQLKRAQRQPVGRAGRLADLVEAVAMLDAPSEDDIGRLTRATLSVRPAAEPGADPAEAAALGGAVPPPAALARAARALQVEAARWARLRVGEELVYSWPAAPATPRALHAVPPPREARDHRDPRRTGKRDPQ
jgi:hypothetical protein